MSINRHYTAWIICIGLKDVSTPLYQSVGEMRPLFVTRAAAKRYCRTMGITVPGPLGIHFTEVNVRVDAARAGELAKETA